MGSEVGFQLPIRCQVQGFKGGRGKDVWRQGSGVRPAIPRLVVGPDARLPRTSPVTLDVLTG